MILKLKKYVMRGRTREQGLDWNDDGIAYTRNIGLGRNIADDLGADHWLITDEQYTRELAEYAGRTAPKVEAPPAEAPVEMVEVPPVVKKPAAKTKRKGQLKDKAVAE